METRKLLATFAFILVVLFTGCKKDEYLGKVGVCPVVGSTIPAKGASGVPLNQVVSATFNEKMNSATLNQSSFTLKGATLVAGTITYNGLVASFSPSSALTPNTTYTGTVKTMAKDLMGNALQEDYVWTFSTDLSPTVISNDPATAATGVLLNKIITANFSVPMDPLSITGTTYTIKQGTTNVAGVVTYSGSMASFTPSVALTPNTVYTGTISTGAKNATGTPMISDYVWTFTAGVSPTVISTDPANGGIGVVLNKVVAATFSVPMNPLTITSTTFTLKQGANPIAGVVTYTGSTASFSPLSPLSPNTVYTGTITTGAINLTGIPLAINYVWTFSTGAVPSVISTDPLNSATGVILNKIVTATFNVPMDPLTLTATTFTLKQGSTLIPGAVSYTGSTASFTPSINLLPGLAYTATITTGAKSPVGIPMASDYVWTFSTGSAPTVTSTDPLNLATGIALNKTVTANFNMAMDPLTITGSTFTVKQGATSVPGTVSYAGTTATFNPSSDFTSGLVYTATVTTGAKSNTSSVPLAANYVWTFTTGSAPAPTVTATDPANLATGIALNKTVTATFSMAMDPLTITGSTFTVKQGSIIVPGNVSYSGITATFSPTNNLVAGTNYTATVTTGAKSSSTGTPVASDHVWNFTTLNPLNPPTTPIYTSIFGAFGGNAGITNQGLNTVINNGSISTTAASTLITGFHDGTTGDVYTETPLNKGLVSGRIYTAAPAPGDAISAAIAANALLAAQVAYNSISPASKPGGIDPGAGELGGLTLAPGIYKSASGTFNISNGNLTLDGQGDPNAEWIFQTAAGLTVGIAGPAGARSVILTNGASAKNVYWYVGSAATINGAGGGIMSGTIISTSGVTFSTAGNAVQTVLNGRAISLVASVTMVNTTINVPLP